MKLHLPVRLFKSVLTCLSAVAVGLTLGSASVTAAETQLDNSPDEEELLLYPAPLTLTSSAVSLAAYTPPSEITIPTGYTEVLVDSVSDITPYSSSATDVAFRLTADVTEDGRTSAIMTSSAGSWYFTSDSVDNLRSLSFSNATSELFDVSYSEKLEFAGLEGVRFSGNSSSYYGAISGWSYSTITLSGNGSVTFSGNSASSYAFASAYGGAIYGARSSTITLSDNESVTFSGNTASSSSSFAYGGAIYGARSSTITLSDNDSVTFSGNTASSSSSFAYGGAIYGYESSTITLSDNGSVEFSGNTASSSSSYDAYGGAIYGGSSSTITLSDNESVTFSGNTASSSSSFAYGGAIYGARSSTITLSDNDSVTFSGNTASSSSSFAYGGAIYGYESSTITLSDNGSVEFSGNTASSSSSYDAYGGAIYGGSSSTITLSDNESVEFSGNTAFSSYSSAAYDAYGGAIYGYESSTITLSGNGSVTFSGNTAFSSYSSAAYDAYGGAIYGYESSTITLSGNGSVTFSENSASSSSSSAYGGAIYGYDDSTITLSGNESVTFSGNTADDYGGAICACGNLNIRNNDSVLFEKNAEVENGTYRLRSIYAGGSGDTISLSAAAGKSIEFRDSVYIASGSTVNLNADYTDADGVVHKQTGDIIFTGAYTEQHLNELLADAEAGRTATAEEILNSRTTQVDAMTNLYGGRLRVEDGAIYMGYGITAHEGSAATVLVKDATLNHAGYDLIFNSGTKLELLGNSNVCAAGVHMQNGSTLVLDISKTEGVYIMESSLCLEGNLQLHPGTEREGENIKLLFVSGGVEAWNKEGFSVSDSASFTTSDIRWVEHFLVANYNETTFNPYEYGIVTFTQPQTASDYYFYEGIRFENCGASSVNRASGGAIYGDVNSTITLSGNGCVEFSGNTASSYGGAIYGNSGSAITLNDNGSVTFSGNTASSDGGAIYGSTIELNGNESVTFSGNKASSSSSSYGYASGGAIDGGTISMSNNGSVTFSGNTASSSSTYGAYAYGGAIYGSSNSTITLSNNGSVTFSGNSVSSSCDEEASSYGGAIYGGENSTITLSGNGSVTFSGNTASFSSYDGYASGGAIDGSGNLSIRNNDSVLFEKNAEVRNGTYRLRSIYAGGSGDIISLSAANGKKIEFRDSVYIASGSTVELNADYIDGSGKAHKQTGDIIFTGAYVTKHLSEVLKESKVNRAPTEKEIYQSSTTELYGMTSLYGGRLRVENGAIFKGNGITVMEGSSATVRVKDAALLHDGSVLTFRSGTMLDLMGENTILADTLQMESGSRLRISATETSGSNVLIGSLKLQGALQILINGNDLGENKVLLYVDGDLSGWDRNRFSVSGGSYKASDFTWKDNFLVLNYHAATFVPQVEGTVLIFSHQTDSATYSHYADIKFVNCVATNGGAIYGGTDSTITLNGKESVAFSGNSADFSGSTNNSASSYGGAIYGDEGSTITMSRNKSVVFSGNEAVCMNPNISYAGGGAIQSGENGNIVLSGNGNITMRGNLAKVNYNPHCSASARGVVHGGAIYGSGNLSICNNDSVLFEKNAEVKNQTYRLRSIYTGGSGDTISLSAAKGKKIEFRDSVYIAPESTLNLNAVYVDANGKKYQQGGDIIFTGAYTEAHLKAISGRDATPLEIRNSGTSEILTMTNLCGGRLRVENGAIYKGNGITAKAGSGGVVRLKDATLDHAGYALTFYAGTSLEMAGYGDITAKTLTLKTGSYLRFSGKDAATCTLIGNLQWEGPVNLTLSSDAFPKRENVILLNVDGEVYGWNNQALTIPNGESWKVTWVDNLLVLNYKESTFDCYYKGDLVSSRQQGSFEYHFYRDVCFEGLESSEKLGGAVNGDDSTITLRNNGSVRFIGNTHHAVEETDDYYSVACGGAIYGDSWADIVFKNNETVLFQGNRAVSSGEFAESPAYGGAVGIDYSSSISLKDNETLTFTDNRAVSSGKAYGGAIFASYGSTIEILNNGKVLFEKNAEVSDGNYRLRSIYNSGSVSLSAREKGEIRFNDSVYIDSLRLNADYEDSDGVLHKQSGDIIFSGKNTAAHLNELLSGAGAGRKAGTAEILASRTSWVRDTYLYGGRLMVEDGAVYEGDELSASKGSTVLLKNASLQLNTLNLNTGSTLELSGSNKMSASVWMQENSNLALSLSAANTTSPLLSLSSGGLFPEGNINVKILSTGSVTDGACYTIIKGQTQPDSWTEDNISLILPNFYKKDTSVLRWNGDTLQFITDLKVAEWANASGNRKWDVNSFNWKDDGNRVRYQNASLVTFGNTGAGVVTLEGQLTPHSVDVINDAGYNYIWQGSGRLTGSMKLTKKGAGTLTIKTTNTYTGGTSISGGVVVLGANNALGSGAVTLSNATLNMDGKIVSNNLTLNGASTIQNGENFRGNFILNGTLKSGSGLNLYTGKTATLKTGTLSGKLSGAGRVVKSGSGTVKLNVTNSYTGGTSISGGTVVLGANNALGTGAVTLSNATLNMGGKIVSNNLTLTGSSKILSGTNYRGNFTMNGNLLAGSSINIISGKTANLKKGNVGGTISGAGNTVINGAVTLNGGKITTNKLTISGSGKKLTANASGLVMNKNASDITLSASGNLTSAGAITARNITLSNKAVLNAKNSAVRNITLGGKLQATDSTVNLFGNLTAGNLVLTRSTLTNNGSSVRNLSLSGALTLSSATLNHYGNISAKNVTATASGIRQTGGPTGMKLSGNLSLGSKSTLNLFGALNAANVTLSGNSVLNNANSTVRNAVVKGKLQATNSTVNLHGNLTAGNVVLNNATLRDNGSSARAVTVTNSTSLSNNAKLNIKGYLRSKNLTLNKSSLRQHSNNSGVALTGTLTMNSGSTLTVQGALSAANMKLSGGTINLTSSSFSTIKVSGTLTLSSVIDLNLGCKLTTGKNYTLIRFNKTNLSSRNNLAKLLGLTGSGATLTLRSTGIILKVTNAAAWNRYLSANKTAFNKAASVVNAITPAAEETEVVEIAADTATTVAAEPAYDRSRADMLVQSNWGVVNASRAFTDTLGNRASNSTAFGADKSSAVWLSAMGASSRLSSDGAAAGSDYNLFGAAVGMEQQLTKKSSLGLAIGESYGRVNSFTSARTKQDTLHTALYGQYSAVERSRDAVLLDWSAAYGRTESKWQGTEWEQKSVQLDARATWAHQLTADTTVSGFAGMQYFASESADIAPRIKSGSIQNLRGEIGVGIGHRATSKTTVYGELSFVGDMVRHNPTAQTEGQRVRGANPGRAGINFSVGGTHAINDKWSVNASYNMELMERANSHSANIGTSYRF